MPYLELHRDAHAPGDVPLPHWEPSLGLHECYELFEELMRDAKTSPKKSSLSRLRLVQSRLAKHAPPERSTIVWPRKDSPAALQGWSIRSSSSPSSSGKDRNTSHHTATAVRATLISRRLRTAAPRRRTSSSRFLRWASSAAAVLAALDVGSIVRHSQHWCAGVASSTAGCVLGVLD